MTKVKGTCHYATHCRLLYSENPNIYQEAVDDEEYNRYNEYLTTMWVHSTQHDDWYEVYGVLFEGGILYGPGDYYGASQSFAQTFVCAPK